LRLAKRVIQGYQKALESVFDFYNGYDPLFTWWVPKPYQELLDLLVDLSDKIEGKANQDLIPKDDGSGIIGNPIGRDAIIYAYERDDNRRKELINKKEEDGRKNPDQEKE
jgi:hypothetical protein